MILSIFFDTLFVITSILHAIYNYIPFQKIQKQKFLVILYYITINTWQKINTPRESVRISHCIRHAKFYNPSYCLSPLEGIIINYNPFSLLEMQKYSNYKGLTYATKVN